MTPGTHHTSHVTRQVTDLFYEGLKVPKHRTGEGEIVFSCHYSGHVKQISRSVKMIDARYAFG